MEKLQIPHSYIFGQYIAAARPSGIISLVPVVTGWYLALISLHDLIFSINDFILLYIIIALGEGGMNLINTGYDKSEDLKNGVVNSSTLGYLTPVNSLILTSIFWSIGLMLTLYSYPLLSSFIYILIMIVGFFYNYPIKGKYRFKNHILLSPISIALGYTLLGGFVFSSHESLSSDGLVFIFLIGSIFLIIGVIKDRKEVLGDVSVGKISIYATLSMRKIEIITDILFIIPILIMLIFAVFVNINWFPLFFFILISQLISFMLLRKNFDNLFLIFQRSLVPFGAGMTITFSTRYFSLDNLIPHSILIILSIASMWLLYFSGTRNVYLAFENVFIRYNQYNEMVPNLTIFFSGLLFETMSSLEIYYKQLANQYQISTKELLTSINNSFVILNRILKLSTYSLYTHYIKGLNNHNGVGQVLETEESLINNFAFYTIQDFLSPLGRFKVHSAVDLIKSNKWTSVLIFNSNSFGIYISLQSLGFNPVYYSKGGNLDSQINLVSINEENDPISNQIHSIVFENIGLRILEFSSIQNELSLSYEKRLPIIFIQEKILDSDTFNSIPNFVKAFEKTTTNYSISGFEHEEIVTTRINVESDSKTYMFFLFNPDVD